MEDFLNEELLCLVFFARISGNELQSLKGRKGLLHIPVMAH